MAEQNIKQEEHDDQMHDLASDSHDDTAHQSQRHSGSYRLHISTEPEDDDDDDTMNRGDMNIDDDDDENEITTYYSRNATHYSQPPCHILTLGHHILECAHRVIAPESFIDTANHLSPCGLNCARQHPSSYTDADDTGTHIYMCKLCFANQLLRRYLPHGSAPPPPAEAIRHVQPMIEHMWAPAELDGQLMIPTLAVVEVAQQQGGGGGDGGGVGAEQHEDQMIAEMLEGLQVREQDLDGLLSQMSGMSM